MTAALAAVPRRAVLVRAAIAALPLAVVATAFVGTRLALLWRFPPFYDEALYASWALRVHDGSGDRFVALANGKLPLLSWLGAGWVYAGIEPLTAVRTVSLAAGAMSLVVASLLAADLGGRKAAMGAAGAYVLMPLALVHDTIGLMEPLVGALLVLALYLQIRLARAPTAATAMLLGLALGAGLLTKETAVLAVVLLPFSLVVFDWRRPAVGRRLAAWIAAAVLACVLAAVVRLVLTLSELWPAYGDVQSTFGTFRGVRDGLAHPLRWLGDAWPGYRPELGGYVTVGLGLVAAFGAVTAVRRRRPEAALCLLWLFAVLAVDVLFLTNAFVRYLVPAAPLLAVFVGVGLAQLVYLAPRLWSGQFATIAAGVVLLAACAQAAWFDARVLADPGAAPYPGLSREEYVRGWPAGTGWREVASVIRREALGRNAVVATYGRASPALPLTLRHDPSITVLEPDAPEAARATLAVSNGEPLPSEAGDWTLRPVWRFSRPFGGAPLVLYRRGVVVNGRFFGRPDELRSGLGLDDSSFDRFLARHADIRDWYLTMSAREAERGAA